MRSKSVDVLNEADAYERKLNWQLFKYEQDTQLWGPRMEAPDDWYPGFNLYKRPRYQYGWVDGGIDMIIDGNTVRPMIEEFIDGDSYWSSNAGDSWNVCEDCEVGWRGWDAECWICGKQLHSLKEIPYFTQALGQVDLYDAIDTQFAFYSMAIQEGQLIIGSLISTINLGSVEEYVPPGVPIWLGLDERVPSEPVIVFPEDLSYKSAVPLPDPPFPEFNAENRAHSEYLSFENLWNRRR